MDAVKEFTDELLAFVDALRLEGYNIGTTQYIAVQDLVAALAARGDLFPRLDRLGNFVGPILCNTPDQQKEFRGRFDPWLDKIGPKLVEGFERPQPRRSSGMLSAELAAIHSESRFGRRWIIGSAAAVITAIIVVFALTREPQPPSPQPPGPDSVEADQAPVQRPPDVPAEPISVPLWVFLGIAGSVGLAYGLWKLWGFVQTGRFLARRVTSEPPDIMRLLVEGADGGIYDDKVLFGAAQRFRRHQRLGASYLDIDATIRRTINEGGFFHPVQTHRLVMPEYLALVDRATFRDHQAHMADAILDWLVAHDVIVVRYYFDGDPRVCYPERVGDRPATLLDLTARHPEHRLLLFSDGKGLFSPLTGELEPWAELFDAWRLRAVLTLDDATGFRARQLAAADFIVRPATERGLDALVERPDLLDLMRRPESELPPTFPPLLRERQLRWLEDHAPDEATLDLLIDELHGYLGPQGFAWLSACAVYPALRWHLTLQLGRALRHNGSALFDQHHLAAMARLPWFRYGRMPDWLRLRLLNELDRDEEQNIRTAIQALLITATEDTKDAEVLEVARHHAAQMPAWGRRLVRRLIGKGKGGEDTPLQEHVFATFMADRLAVRIPKLVRGLIRGTGVPRPAPAPVAAPARVDLELPDPVTKVGWWLVASLAVGWTLGGIGVATFTTGDPTTLSLLLFALGWGLLPFVSGFVLGVLGRATRVRGFAIAGFTACIATAVIFLREMLYALDASGDDPLIVADVWVALGAMWLIAVGGAIQAWRVPSVASVATRVTRAWKSANRMLPASVLLTVTTYGLIVFGVSTDWTDEVFSFLSAYLVSTVLALSVALVVLGFSSGNRWAAWAGISHVAGAVGLITMAAIDETLLVAGWIWPALATGVASWIAVKKYERPRAVLAMPAADAAQRKAAAEAFAGRLASMLRRTISVSAVVMTAAGIGVVLHAGNPEGLAELTTGWGMMAVTLLGGTVCLYAYLLQHRGALILGASQMVLAVGVLTTNEVIYATAQQAFPSFDLSFYGLFGSSGGLTIAAMAVWLVLAIGVWRSLIPATPVSALRRVPRTVRRVTLGAGVLWMIVLIPPLMVTALGSLWAVLLVLLVSAVLALLGLGTALGERRVQTTAWIHLFGMAGAVACALAFASVVLSTGEPVGLPQLVYIVPRGMEFLLAEMGNRVFVYAWIVLYAAAVGVSSVRTYRGAGSEPLFASLTDAEGEDAEAEQPAVQDTTSDEALTRRTTAAVRWAVGLSWTAFASGAAIHWLERSNAGNIVPWLMLAACFLGTTLIGLAYPLRAWRVATLGIAQVAAVLPFFVIAASDYSDFGSIAGLLAILVVALTAYGTRVRRHVYEADADTHGRLERFIRVLTRTALVGLAVSVVWFWVGYPDGTEGLLGWLWALVYLVGVVAAGICLIFLGAIMRRKPVWQVGIVHLVGNVVAVVIFSLTWELFSSSAPTEPLPWFALYATVAGVLSRRIAPRPRRAAPAEQGADTSEGEGAEAPPQEQASEGDSGRPTVFLSHAREDADAVERVIAELQGAGITTLRTDQWVEPGEEWEAAIGRAIDSANAMIVFWSQASIRSNFVVQEATLGMDRDMLIPVLLDDSTPPVEFRQLHAISLADWRTGSRTGMVALMRAVTDRVARIP